MALPTLTDFAQNLYDEFAPLQDGDADPTIDYALAKYCAAVAEPFDFVWDLVMLPDVQWQTIMSLPDCPAEFLDWLGYFKGVAVPATDDATKRALIADASGWDRGTITAMIAAAQSRLTGSKHVDVQERTPDAWTVTMTVYGGEILNGDNQALINAINDVKPAGIQLVLNGLPIQTWDSVQAATTWDSVPAPTTWDNATGL